MTEITELQLLPLLRVSIGGQEIILDPDTAAELFDALEQIVDPDPERELAAREGAFQAGYTAVKAAQAPAGSGSADTVWFDYTGARRQVAVLTLKPGAEDYLLVGVELVKDGVLTTDRPIKSYRIGGMELLQPGTPVQL